MLKNCVVELINEEEQSCYDKYKFFSNCSIRNIESNIENYITNNLTSKRIHLLLRTIVRRWRSFCNSWQAHIYFFRVATISKLYVFFVAWINVRRKLKMFKELWKISLHNYIFGTQLSILELALYIERYHWWSSGNGGARCTGPIGA